jgi:hypothetical protein
VSEGERAPEGTTAVPAVSASLAANTAAGAPSVQCPTCGQPRRADSGAARGSGWSGNVYAVGRIVPQFPSESVEKEFAQLAADVDPGGGGEIELLQRVLEDPDNRYLARHVCWVFTIQEIETFVVQPRDDADVTRLVELMEPDEAEDVVHVVIGHAAHAGRTDAECSSLGLPSVIADQMLGFTLDEFAEAMSAGQADGADAEPPADANGDDDARRHFRAVVRRVFLRLTRSTGNYGMADEHRARNYVALRYPSFYAAVLQAYREGKMLVSVDARHVHSSTRRVVSVGFTVRHRTDITERYHCLVDVLDLFPFLIKRLEPTYD